MFSNGFHHNDLIDGALSGDGGYDVMYRMMWKYKDWKRMNNEYVAYDVGRDLIGSCCNTPWWEWMSGVEMLKWKNVLDEYES